MFLTLDYFTHVGIMCANVCSNLQIATTLVLTLVPFWNVLSGFYVPKPVSLVHRKPMSTVIACFALELCVAVSVQPIAMGCSYAHTKGVQSVALCSESMYMCIQ